MARIVICPHNYFPFQWAGGETYLRSLIRLLRKSNHEIRIITYTDSQYEYDGIQCYPQGSMADIWKSNNEHFQWCEAVIGQLMGTAYSYNKAQQHKKPHYFIAHNTAKSYPIATATKVIYNSHTLANMGLYAQKSVILQPLIDYRDFKRSKGRKVALINCNHNKGVEQFVEMAKKLPHLQFVGYKGGYGEQYTPDTANIEWKENGDIDWSEIGCLVVPSETESWSQVATEAICCGIPVIASPLAGIKENLSYAGIYIDRNNVNSYCSEIERVIGNKEQQWLCLKRAKELDPLPRYEAFEKWFVNSIR